MTQEGQAVPELMALLCLSELYGMTIDRIVKDDDECNVLLSKEADLNISAIIPFLIRAKQRTYAEKGNTTKSSRAALHDFSGDFLKEALGHVPFKMPYRGLEIYSKGEYHYHCKVEGEFVWYQGYEEIFYLDEKIYECHFHGGEVR